MDYVNQLSLFFQLHFFSFFNLPSSSIAHRPFSFIMSSLTPYDLNQICAVPARMNLVINEEKIETKASLENRVFHLLQTSRWVFPISYFLFLTLSHRGFGKLCPLRYKNSSIWNKLPCSVEIKKTLKRNIAVHYQQGPELKKRYGNSISSKMSSLSQQTSCLRCSLPFALIHWSTERR